MPLRRGCLCCKSLSREPHPHYATPSETMTPARPAPLSALGAGQRRDCPPRNANQSRFPRRKAVSIVRKMVNFLLRGD